MHMLPTYLHYKMIKLRRFEPKKLVQTTTTILLLTTTQICQCSVKSIESYFVLLCADILQSLCYV